MPKSIADVRTYWNTNPVRGEWKTFAQEYERLKRKEDWYFELVDRLNVKGKDVLEVGSGQGLITYYLKKKGARAIGADLSEESVKQANKRFAKEGMKAACVVSNAEQLKEFKNSQFDTVISLGVLHHTPHIEKSSASIARVLRKDGKLVLMLYYTWSLQFILIKILRAINWKNWLYNLLSPNKKEKYRTFFTEMFTCPVLNTYSKEEVKTIFSQFEDFEFELVHTGLTRAIDFAQISNKTEKNILKLDHALKGMFGCYLIATATKKK